ncbi:MAG TPA: DUF4019 domain-containing protein [Casimicrobiaceae bacterium]|nr:DUF4019 domain-containing protein [Casimicrobiaceae bacterium]
MKLRASAWLALAAVAMLAVGVVLAQSPQASLVQETARGWLAMTDRGDAAASWQAAGPPFQNAITRERWAESLAQVREPLGTLTGRAIQSTEFRKTFPGAPDGDYAVVVFHTTFSKKAVARETVTLQREGDGAWRVIGYLIR